VADADADEPAHRRLPGLLLETAVLPELADLVAGVAVG
jgi:hypothetical protein